MSYCQSCGTQLPDNSAFCGSCGASQFNNNNVNNGAYSHNVDQTPISKGIHILLVVLSVFFPLVGIIAFFVFKDGVNANVGKKCLIAAIISVLFFYVIPIFMLSISQAQFEREYLYGTEGSSYTPSIASIAGYALSTPIFS